MCVDDGCPCDVGLDDADNGHDLSRYCLCTVLYATCTAVIRYFTDPLLISEGGKCTLGVHLSWEYYIVIIYEVLYQLECSIFILVC